MRSKFVKESEGVKLNLSPMIDCTFLLIIYFIVSMQMEPSLDNIIKLPPVYNAKQQEDALLQIYVLPAKIEEGGRINPDSTGLIAFSDKAKTPQTNPINPAIRYFDERGNYIPNSLLGPDGKPIEDLKKEMAKAYGELAKPPAFTCAKTGMEISPYLKLDDIPKILMDKKKEVVKLMIRQKNARNANNKKPPLSSEEEKQLEKEIALMIKADEKAFYGRILQVVNMARDTLCDIKNFAFVSNSEAAADVREKKAKRAAK